MSDCHYQKINKLMKFQYFAFICNGRQEKMYQTEVNNWYINCTKPNKKNKRH